MSPPAWRSVLKSKSSSSTARMLSNWKFAHRIWLLPALAAAALGLVLALGAALGGRNVRTLTQIEQGYYPAVELRHALLADLVALHRILHNSCPPTAGDALHDPTPTPH